MRYFLFLPLFILMSCSSTSMTQQETVVNVSDLISKQWMVTTLNGNAILKGTEISFFVSEKGKVKGNAGVNSYFGQWAINGDQITSSKMASTKKFGVKPKGIMQQEGQFLTTLSMITHWRNEGGELQLLNGNEIVIRLSLFQ